MTWFMFLFMAVPFFATTQYDGRLQDANALPAHREHMTPYLATYYPYVPPKPVQDPKACETFTNAERPENKAFCDAYNQTHTIFD